MKRKRAKDIIQTIRILYQPCIEHTTRCNNCIRWTLGGTNYNVYFCPVIINDKRPDLNHAVLYAFPVCWPQKRHFSHSHMHIHSLMAEAAMRGANLLSSSNSRGLKPVTFGFLDSHFWVTAAPWPEYRGMHQIVTSVVHYTGPHAQAAYNQRSV